MLDRQTGRSRTRYIVSPRHEAANSRGINILINILLPIMSSGDAITDDGYFNDLSRQPSLPQNGSDSPPERSATTMNVEEGGAPRQKRVACVICRKRKLKCDGSKPKCGTCARLGHCCAYDEVRRKSGPKRGYVKELEARLGWYIRQET